MPSMVFRNAGVPRGASRSRLRKLKSQCPQWSFAMQGYHSSRYHTPPASRKSAMPSMVFRNAGPVGEIQPDVGQKVAMPSMVFRNAGGCCRSRSSAPSCRNALNGLSQCRVDAVGSRSSAPSCRNALNGLSQCRSPRRASRREASRWSRNALNGLSQCRKTEQCRKLPPVQRVAMPSMVFRNAGTLFAVLVALLVKKGRNALNGLSQCRLRTLSSTDDRLIKKVAMPSMVFRNAGSAALVATSTRPLESQCPQWSFAMQVTRLLNSSSPLRLVAMPSMVFRNAGQNSG